MSINFKPHVLYAPNIFYHNSCCMKFAIKKVTVGKDENMEILRNGSLEEFFLGLKKRPQFLSLMTIRNKL